MKRQASEREDESCNDWPSDHEEEDKYDASDAYNPADDFVMQSGQSRVCPVKPSF